MSHDKPPNQVPNDPGNGAGPAPTSVNAGNTNVTV